MLSEPQNLAPICYELNRWFQEKSPDLMISVWDVGPGWGKWAILLREILASIRAEAGDMTPGVPVWITGFEMCEYFYARLQRMGDLYNRLYFEDFRACIWGDQGIFPHLVLMFDVLEHWDPISIKGVISHLIDRHSKAEILVSVPREVHMYSEPFYGENCPKHRNNLILEDYQEMFPDLQITEVHRGASDIFWIRS